MNYKNRLINWLNLSVGNRIRFVSVATAFSLVLVLGVASFPLFFYQAWKNYSEHIHNNLDRIGDTFEFRLSATQQALDQLAKSSFVVNSLVDSSGREVYLSPTLRDFRLPIDIPVKLILFDANMVPFGGNMPDFATTGMQLQKTAALSLKQQKGQLLAYTSDGHNNLALAFPIYYPPASSYEGVLLALIDNDLLFRLPPSYFDDNDCITVSMASSPMYTANCDATLVSGNVSRPLMQEKQLANNKDLSLSYSEKSRSFLLQLLLVFLIYLLIGVAAVAGAFVLSRRASRLFVGQLQTLSEASLALAESPNAQTRVSWEHPDEIGQFVEAFNTMVDRLQKFQVSLETLVDERTNELSIILDNVVDGIISIDERGIIQSFNRAAESIFGYQANEVVGHNLKLLMPEPYYTQHDDYLKRYRDTGVARVIGMDSREVIGRRKDGSIFPMDIAISSSMQHDQPLFIGVVRDITERKRIDQMKSEFVSTVSHELRTPLTSISGALGLISGGVLGEIPPQAKQMIDMAHKNSLRLAHLINDLLDMEKIVAGKMTLVLEEQSLMMLVKQALESISAYGDQYKVGFNLISQDDVTVKVDSGRLIQVLNNFLSNAAKFSQQGGQVDIAVRRINGMVRVEVIDHGAGIPADFRERIFQKFSQADSSDTRQKGGTGLGLAISKELIERMHGEIGFDSVEGQGATFYFELPL